MTCDFVIQLSRLRKLSAESVENTDHFDPFKEYLHVVRPVEMQRWRWKISFDILFKEFGSRRAFSRL